MEELKHIGLITQPETKKYYLDKFGRDLKYNANYQVYVSKKHGGGAGRYLISKVSVNDENIVVSLDFVLRMFEAGAAVINQRVLFLKVEPNCKIVDVISSYPAKKQK